VLAVRCGWGCEGVHVRYASPGASGNGWNAENLQLQGRKGPVLEGGAIVPVVGWGMKHDTLALWGAQLGPVF
jgi:hypothetical protein